ncbi:MAG: hypothetical protein M1832_005553 [Thelocarpon impressellum]|nr:MAG: hypothetical protein M1832_005553 [Thelocarpon impressellum]
MDTASPLRLSLHSNMRSEMPALKSGSDRNILKVVLGDLLFDTWYGSFYPDELVGGGRQEVDRLYVCRWCFRYSKELMPYMAHVKLCRSKLGAPPGQLIYEKDCYSIYEVNGEDHPLFCQNLSLFAKLFLDNKSVCFDLATFNYYLLVYTYPAAVSSSPGEASTTHQVVGFFSKEKMSWDNNNLACILVFPPWQRKGLGKILMGVSYELSKREGRIGGPEKPLSDLGRRGYLSFWSSTIARFILAAPARKPFTIKDVSEDTFILADDVIAALKEMNVLNPRQRAGGAMGVNKVKVREWARGNGVDLAPVVDAEGFLEQ